MLPRLRRRLATNPGTSIDAVLGAIIQDVKMALRKPADTVCFGPVAPAPDPGCADLGLYVHVAFCQTRCFYCDFNTYAGLGHLIAPYVDALVAEIGTLPHFPTPRLRPLSSGSPGEVSAGVGCSATEVASYLDEARLRGLPESAQADFVT
ncbi:MAG: hypothetical protein HYY04_16065, partial [Chloroflexi bacterium]|nr:hypothetical protein [Chloroflexota bacterium]